ncbi:DNA-binding domain-containing protein [Coralloluteibacterium stylophorae]|uniref:DNA-binding domain-containing protein n=1 Tax=Coralloluteibacterium stylophorae TaxID=1776034 RepID=A0A8J7VS86_9GAMM|nr:DNA-binding domain-containing protein [Coralloluteibacterium stylophorae]MBS7456875.1 putative DNA-binding domain-containing protein [Coralloluteibacterium stylophorae]
MSALARFQRNFAEALGNASPDSGPTRHRAFAVYRNTVMRGCLDALEANYPAIVCLVGRDWFRAAAAEYATARPPRDGRLFGYGEDFASFLSRFEPARDLTYLADVARLDRLWTESLVAADGGTLDAAALRGLSPRRLARLRLRLHPATRLFASALPAFSIWKASRAGLSPAGDLAWQAEHALVARVGPEVRVAAVSTPALHFLDACARGDTLAEAAEAACGQSADARVDLILAALLGAGAFTTT